MTEVLYRRAPGAVDAVVDGQVVLLAPVDFSYQSLDRVGGRVWELLAEPRTMDDLVGMLRSQFDVDEDRCRADLLPFLDRMTSLGILQRDES